MQSDHSINVPEPLHHLPLLQFYSILAQLLGVAVPEGLSLQEEMQPQGW
jgi:hypothetical protein